MLLLLPHCRCRLDISLQAALLYAGCKQQNAAGMAILGKSCMELHPLTTFRSLPWVAGRGVCLGWAAAAKKFLELSGRAVTGAAICAYFFPGKQGFSGNRTTCDSKDFFLLSKQLSISKVISNEKCLSTLQLEGWRKFCFLSVYFFPFILKNEDGWRNRRARAGGEEEREQKCFQRETFYLAFFTVFCKTYTYFKWKHEFKRPGNVLSGDKLAPCQAASVGRDPAWQQQRVSSPSHLPPGRHIPAWFGLRRKGSTGTFTLVPSVRDWTPMGIGLSWLRSRQAEVRSEVCVRGRMRAIGLKVKRTRSKL